jgi:predicted nucleic acid-binding protein
MTTSVVVDASVLVAILTAEGKLGERAAEACRGSLLAAPELMPFEAANVLRRLELAGTIDATGARLAHRDLLDLEVDLWPYDVVATRAWQLRGSLSIYDAAYAAVAEEIEAPLVTLDARLAGANGLRCQVVLIEQG